MVNSRVARLLAIGLLTGLAGGLLGVGGGFVMVPAMVYLLKTPQREANGTSLAVIAPVAIVGATILAQGHQVDLSNTYGTEQNRSVFALTLVAIAAALLGLAAVLRAGPGGRIALVAGTIALLLSVAWGALALAG